MNRIPPMSEEAEMAVLGSVLLDPDRVLPLLGTAGTKNEWFYIPANRQVAEAILTLAAAGKVVDVVSVTDALRASDELEQIGGSQYLDKLVDETPTAANAEYYLGIVRLKWLLRKIITIAREVENMAMEPDATEDVLCQVQGKVATLIDDAARGRVEETNAEVMNKSIITWKDAHDNKKPAIGLRLPWEKMTMLSCGLEPGLIILAGRPSAGKTTIEDQVRCHLAMQGIGVAAVTLDGTRKSLLERSIARKAGVSLPKMKFGFAGSSQLARSEEAAQTIGKYPMWIRDDLRTCGEICSFFRAMVMKYGVQLLTVDYLQLIGVPEMGRMEWQDNVRVSYISGQLKKLALALKVPVLALSQLSRAPEREDRIPTLSDLRDSGAIEQDAEKVFFVYIDTKKRKEMEAEKPNSTKHKRPVYIDLQKHKDGSTGFIPYWMYPPYFRLDETESFDDVQGEYEDPPEMDDDVDPDRGGILPGEGRQED